MKRFAVTGIKYFENLYAAGYSMSCPDFINIVNKTFIQNTVVLRSLNTFNEMSVQFSECANDSSCCRKCFGLKAV
jgi:hypothetical protein